jgi:hypothetical protein
VQPSQPVQEAPKKRSHAGLIVVIVLVAAIILGSVGGFVWAKFFRDTGSVSTVRDEDEDSDRKSDKEDDEDEEAETLDLAAAAIESGDYAGALDLLDELDDPSDTERYDELKRAAELQPALVSVDSDGYPTVMITISHGGDALSKGDLSLTDNGAACAITDVTEGADGQTVLTVTLSGDGQVDEHTLALSIASGSFTIPVDPFTVQAVYQEASVSFTAADTSEFPTVRAYFQVIGEGGAAATGLTASDFALTESVGSGEAVSQEILSAHQLDNAEGLSVTLIADKSGSVTSSDLTKIKSAMTAFAGSLQYSVGDQAEVLAFDSLVRQMCMYTDQSSRLNNAVSNLYSEGSAALYDALVTGIAHAAQQDGARCVIAFTVGPDTASAHTSSDVIQAAVNSGVPVYLIGVGSKADSNTLPSIAEQTGGQYFALDSFDDLEAAYAAIYQQEKSVYAIEYTTDASSSGSRTVSLTLSGSGLRGEADGSFTPSTATEADTYYHESRYELFVDDISWEDAKLRCEELGGHLVTITSQSEMDTVITLAKNSGIGYIWLGGFTMYDAQGNAFGAWITGEDFSYENWSTGEPSRTDRDGTDEPYMMLWNVESLGGWTWNDQRNDPVADGFFAGKIGYICEWE